MGPEGSCRNTNLSSTLEKAQPRGAVPEHRIACSTVQPRGAEIAPKRWDTAMCQGQHAASTGLSPLDVAWPRDCGNAAGE